MVKTKSIIKHLIAVFLLTSSVSITMPGLLLSAEPVLISDKPLNGQYIGKHIEYLDESVLYQMRCNDLDLEDAYKRMICSGKLVSDKMIKVEREWKSTGYRVYFKPADKEETRQYFEVNIADLNGNENSSRFVTSDRRIPILAFNHRPYWLRFKVLNTSDAPLDFLLELDKYLIGSVHVFTPTKKGFTSKRMSYDQALTQREIKHKNFVLPLSAPLGETTYYMLVYSWSGSMKESIPVRIWSPDHFTSQISSDGLYSGIMIGLFLFIFVYNIIIFIAVRDRSYVYLSMVTLCQLIVEMSVSGLGFQYLWPDNPLFTFQALYQSMAFVIAFNLLFYRSFLGISQYTPILGKGLFFLSCFFMAYGLSFFIFAQPIREMMFFVLFLLDHIYSLPVLIPAILAVKNRNRSGMYVLIGIAFYMIGQLKFGLTNQDIIPYDSFKYLPFKGLSFLIIMTLGLSDKLNTMKNSLLDLNINLERRVTERTERLKKANEKLKELDTLKTRFFDNISHELRTPLTLITAPLESLIKGEYGKLPKRGLETIGSIKKNTDRLLKLISDLLDFSKIEAGKMNVKIRNCDVSSFLRFCVSSVASSAEAKGLAISFQDNTKGLQAPIDSDLLEKAVFNLLSNAIKFNRPQGTISVILEYKPDYFSIIVKDTGIGIPGDQLDNVFDRFNQVDSSITRRHEGTGIGLSLTREIVELHNGLIQVDSQINEGSMFTIIVPVDSNKDNQNHNRHHNLSSDEPNDFRSEVKYGKNTLNEETDAEAVTVLIVEDNDDLRDYLEGILRNKYQVVKAINGKDALIKLETEAIDLVLTDIMMPEMDGYELTQTIRSNQKHENVPIILLTAKSQVPDKVVGFDKGANDYIVKPFNAEEVLARIKAQLKLKLLRDKLIKVNLNLKGKRKILTDESKIKIEMVKEFLNDNYQEDIFRDELASVADMSPDHLGKLFKQSTGEKISDYINKRRIEDASKQLTNSRTKIVDIAYNVGFGSLRSFNQVFRDIMGDSPSNFRKKN